MDSFEANRRDPDPIVTPTDRVRQGVISGRVVTVLTISISLCVAALFIAWVIFK